jgi:hypothetical protein
MTIWEKAVVNVQQGVQKVNAVAAVFSERVKAEIAIVRLRIRINEIQKRIEELYQIIGRIIVDLKNRGEIPKTTEQLLKDEDIVVAMNELEDQKKEIEDLQTEIRIEQEALKPALKQKEDTTE